MHLLIPIYTFMNWDFFFTNSASISFRFSPPRIPKFREAGRAVRTRFIVQLHWLLRQFALLVSQQELKQSLQMEFTELH